MKRGTINCPFCNAVIRNEFFADSIHFAAVYNISPVLPGHSLIIPKFHIESFLLLEKHLLEELLYFTQNVLQAILQEFNAEGFDLTLQEKEEAGQSISHLHLHVIPRQPNDLSGDWFEKLEAIRSLPIDSELRPRLDSIELRRVTDRLRDSWRRHCTVERTK